MKNLVTFIRSPTWITAGYAQSKAGPGGSNFECRLLPNQTVAKYLTVAVSDDQKKHFREDDIDYAAYRKDVEQELNSRFKFVSTGPSSPWDSD